MIRVAVLVSGGGTNLQALIDAEKRGELGCGKIVCVVSSSAEAYALTRAKDAGIESAVISRKGFSSAEEFDKALADELLSRNIDLVVLAGYISIIGSHVLSAYSNRIINVHPALIPSFCGKGFYGLHVHKAALDYGVKVTGATVHLVNEVVDGGEILLQKAVDILSDDTPETLQRRVMEQAEWILLPKAVAIMCDKITEKGSSYNG